MQKTTFAAGCFWRIQAEFDKVTGVVSTIVGYTGGDLDNPTYKQVCTGETGHAEAVQIEFDEKTVSFKQLLQIFWKLHDPTQRNKQGVDIGTQYRSAIFYETDLQEEQAIKSRFDLQQKLDKAIVTQIMPATKFWPAEKYHQKYLSKKNNITCRGFE